MILISTVGSFCSLLSKTSTAFQKYHFVSIVRKGYDKIILKYAYYLQEGETVLNNTPLFSQNKMIKLQLFNRVKKYFPNCCLREF